VPWCTSRVAYVGNITETDRERERQRERERDRQRDRDNKAGKRLDRSNDKG
jgi:hypothetical protein